MKKIITLCLMLVMSGVAMSQEKKAVAPGPETSVAANAKKTTDKWAMKLEMTADQKAKTYDVVYAKMDARATALNKYKMDHNEAKKTAALDKITAELKSEMKLILTDGQKYHMWENYIDRNK